MGKLQDLVDVDDSNSLSNRLRSRRFAKFEALTRELPRPLRILDVGGTGAFWEQRGWADREDVAITLVNLEAEARRHPNIDSVGGGFEAIAAYPSGSFDVVFSNSVIEHLFTFERQRQMADAIRRAAPRYWVQTPNFWFPIEPHFLFPGWQWLPTSVRVALLRRFRCGCIGPYPDPALARQVVEEVRLLTRREMQTLFPDGAVWAERFCGLAKSWVAYGGWRESSTAAARTKRGPG